jgi:DNA-binding NarL/FixJ family response regulator
VACIQQWARGALDADADALLGAAQQLLALGNPLFARESADAAVRLGGPSLPRARTLAQQATAMLTGGPADAGGSILDGLTPREREVTERAARGESNKEIAAALVLSVRTVESYLQSAFGKLGVRGRAELAELLAP